MQRLQVITTPVLKRIKLAYEIQYGTPYIDVMLGKQRAFSPMYVMPSSEGQLFGAQYEMRYHGDYHYRLRCLDSSYTLEHVEMDFLFAAAVGIVVTEKINELLDFSTWQLRPGAKLATHPRNN